MNGTFRGDCEGRTKFAITNYTYAEGDNWAQFWTDVNNGQVQVEGGPFCSYGNYSIQTSQQYWNNATQYWQSDLLMINLQQPSCSYHLKNVTQPSFQQEQVVSVQPTQSSNSSVAVGNNNETVTQPENSTSFVSPNVLNGMYNLSGQCDPDQCNCWNQVHLDFDNYTGLSYIFNVSLPENQGFGFQAVFPGSFDELENELSYNFLNLTNFTIYIQYYDNNTQSGQVRAEQIVLTQQWLQNCSITLTRIPSWENDYEMMTMFQQNSWNVSNQTNDSSVLSNQSLSFQFQWNVSNFTNTSSNSSWQQQNQSLPQYNNQSNFYPSQFSNYSNFTNNSFPAFQNQSISNQSNSSVFSNQSNVYQQPQQNVSNNNSNIGGVFDYFDGLYKIYQTTPCDFSEGCTCWKNVYLLNVVPEDDQDEPYILFNGTLITKQGKQPQVKIQKLYYPSIYGYESDVNLTSANNATSIQLQTGNTQYNNQTQMYFNDITIIDNYNPQCVYNMTNLTGFYSSSEFFIENRLKSLIKLI